MSAGFINSPYEVFFLFRFVGGDAHGEGSAFYEYHVGRRGLRGQGGVEGKCQYNYRKDFFFISITSFAFYPHIFMYSVLPLSPPLFPKN